MPDLSHQWGADIAVGATGDVALADGLVLGQQRVLRRLLTNPGDYLWQPDYGAGLGRFIGQPGNVLQISAVIRSQIFREDAVARSPEPEIDVRFDDAGTLYVQLRYADAESGQAQLLAFSVGG
jgi:phage baseplate assembly protein W